MAGYTHEYSSFPNSTMTLDMMRTFKDIDSSVGKVVADLQKAKASNDFKEVARIMEENPELIDYIIDASIINQLVEEIRNTQIFAKTAQQSIYIGDKPPVTYYGDIRIGQPSV